MTNTQQEPQDPDVSSPNATGTLAPHAFDDQPIEAILYGTAAPPRSPACIFSESAAEVDKVMAAVRAERFPEALALARRLLVSGKPLTRDARRVFALLAGRLVPPWPCPILVDHGFPCETILEPLWRDAVDRHDVGLQETVGWPLFRLYESCSAYGPAREIIGPLLVHARKRRLPLQVAALVNNFGYEYLLESRWDAAEPYFGESAALFDSAGAPREAINVRANALACRFGRLGPEHAQELEGELRQLAEELQGDWRRRKPLVLLARLEEHRGRLSEAIDLMTQALAAAKEIPTKLRLEDEAYLQALACSLSVTPRRDTEPPRCCPR